MERPPTRYARNGDLAIAYQVHGSGEHDLLLSSGTASNVETLWGIPEAARLFERLGGFARVIRFDRRDSGLSDPIADDLTLEAHADDALAVIEAAGAERPVLIGSIDSARSLALLAATRPERVGGLIAFSPSVRGGAAASPEFAESVAETLSDFADFPSRRVLSLYAPEWAADPVRARPHGPLLPIDLHPRAGRADAAPLPGKRHRRRPAAGPGADPGPAPARVADDPGRGGARVRRPDSRRDLPGDPRHRGAAVRARRRPAGGNHRGVRHRLGALRG